MRKLLSAIGLFVAIFSAAIAGPREDAIQLVGMWPNEFTDSDVDGIVERYAPDALLTGREARTRNHRRPLRGAFRAGHRSGRSSIAAARREGRS